MKIVSNILRSVPALLCGCSLFFGACDNSEEAVSGGTGDGRVSFRSSDIKPMKSRVSGAAWDNGDRVGIYMKKAGAALNAGNIVEGGDNREYSASAAGSLVAVSDPLYYPLNGDKVDFVAYYPYTQGIAGYAFVADFAAKQNAPQEIDLLYSNNAANKDANNPSVSLSFEHQFSKLTMRIVKGVGVTDLDFSALAVKIKGMPGKVSFDLGTKAVTSQGNGDIVPRTVTAGTLYEAIVAPGKAADRKVDFELDGTTYTWAIPAELVLTAGKNHRYNVTVNKISTITIEVAEADVEDWTPEGPAEEIGISKVRGVEFISLPAGEFMMGSPVGVGKDNERPQHKVTLTKGFRMSKYLITNAQFAEFMNARGIGSNAKYAGGLYPDKALVKSGSWVGVRWKDDEWQPEQPSVSQWPVINVSWYGAMEFARWIGGRLPTEAEWEYACRAGTTTKYYTGDQINVDEVQAILSGIKAPGSNENKQFIVGSCPPNPWGFYEMIGSVEEWVSDSYYTYTEDAAVDPSHPVLSDKVVARGAAWWHSAADAGSAFRRDKAPDTLSDSQGFRIVLSE